MSMINRMLTDLERRGAATPRAGDAGLVADPAPPRRRWRAASRLFPLLLAVVLVALAAALWIERGDRVLAVWDSVTAPAASRSAAVESGEDDAAATVAADSAADAGADEPPAAGAEEPGTGNGESVDVAALARMETESGTGSAASEAAPASRPEPDAGTDSGPGSQPASAEPASGAGPEAQADTEPATAEVETRGGAEPVSVADEAADDGPASGEAGGGGGEGSIAADGNPPGQSLEEMQSLADADSASGGGEARSGGNGVRKSQSLAPELRARRRYQQGSEALRAGEISRARRLLTEALELEPALHEGRDLLVALMRRAGDPAAARALLAEGVELAPARPQFAMPYARLLVDTGELERAANVLARARSAAGDNPGYHALTAAVAQRRGHHEQAARAYTRALELDADNGVWWLGLGISLAATERAQEARAAFREARASGDLGERLDRWAAGRIEELGGGD